MSAAVPDRRTNFEFELSDKEFRFLAEFLSSHTGIVLSSHKHDMVRGRLVKRLRALGLGSFQDYCRLLDGPQGDDEVENVVNAITTNVTHFFRESHHFKFLREEMIAMRATAKIGTRLRIWSAGCSSGQEPYSIAMTLLDALQKNVGDTLVLATDIDTNMLAHAAAGCYPQEAAAHIPETYKRRYTQRGTNPDEWEVTDEVKRIIRFRRLNLHQKWPMKGPFDAIFCRNVAIYFDKPTQKQLMNRYADILKPGGLLFLGHAESLIGASDRFASAEKTVYRRLP